MTVSFKAFVCEANKAPSWKESPVGDNAPKAKILAKELTPVLLEIAPTLPKVHSASDPASCPEFVEPFWNEVTEKHPNVGVILPLLTLQESGTVITSTFSLEQTVEDLAAEIYLFPSLKALTRFRHVFVKVAEKAVIYIKRILHEGRMSARLEGALYFSPYDDKNVPLTSEQLAADLLQNADGPGLDKFEESCLVSVKIPDFVLAAPLPDEARSTKRWRILDQELEDAPIHRVNVAVAIVKAGLKEILNKQWDKHVALKGEREKDLWDTLTRVEYWNPRDRAPDFVTLREHDRPAMPSQSRARLPIVKGDHDRPGGFHLAVPVAEFKFLVAAEREQIENLRSIKSLFQYYVEDEVQYNKDGKVKTKPRHEVPLSIAVFAPPGAGKSFAVKEIAKSVHYDEDEMLEFNVAQFRTTKDLDNAFDTVSERYQTIFR